MNHTALHLLAAQTLKKETGKHKSLLEYYGSLVGQHAGTLLQISVFFVLDAYFSCKPYVDESCECGLHLVTRLRDDSVLYYPYIVRQHEGRGRHKKFAGRVDIRNLNEEFFCACICDEQDGTAYKSRV